MDISQYHKFFSPKYLLLLRGFISSVIEFYWLKLSNLMDRSSKKPNLPSKCHSVVKYSPVWTIPRKTCVFFNSGSTSVGVREFVLRETRLEFTDDERRRATPLMSSTPQGGYWWGGESLQTDGVIALIVATQHRDNTTFTSSSLSSSHFPSSLLFTSSFHFLFFLPPPPLRIIIFSFFFV